MHGYGYPPEQPPRLRPSQATLTLLRVLFVALTVLSCGLLAWGAMLRLAIVTRKGLDWALLVLVFALNVGLFAFIVSTPDDPDKMTDAQALIGGAWLFGVVFGVIAYYLYADIRHFGRNGPYGGPNRGSLPATPGAVPAPYGGYPLPRAQAVTPATPTPGYGYRPPAPRPPGRQPAAPPVPQPPVSAPTPPPAAPRPAAPRPVPPQPASPQPASPQPASPQPASPQRLDEVRAELDELSDYLRKEGGSR